MGVAVWRLWGLRVYSEPRASFDGVSKGGAGLLLDNFFYPLLALPLLVSGKDEPSLSVVPVLLAILPCLRIVAVVVLGSELFVGDGGVVELVLLRLSFPRVSNRHRVSFDDFGLVLGYAFSW